MAVCCHLGAADFWHATCVVVVGTGPDTPVVAVDKQYQVSVSTEVLQGAAAQTKVSGGRARNSSRGLRRYGASTSCGFVRLLCSSASLEDLLWISLGGYPSLQGCLSHGFGFCLSVICCTKLPWYV